MKPIYDIIGTTYNTTRQADPYIAGRLFYFLNPHPSGTYLDTGGGKGNYNLALSKKGW